MEAENTCILKDKIANANVTLEYCGELVAWLVSETGGSPMWCKGLDLVLGDNRFKSDPGALG